MRWHVRTVASSLLLGLFAALAFGQFTGGLQGILEDASGGGIPNASVRLRNLSTGVVAESKTNESGEYHFRSLAPGRYELTAEAPISAVVPSDPICVTLVRLSLPAVDSAMPPKGSVMVVGADWS